MRICFVQQPLPRLPYSPILTGIPFTLFGISDTNYTLSPHRNTTITRAISYGHKMGYQDPGSLAQGPLTRISRNSGGKNHSHQILPRNPLRVAQVVANRSPDT